MSVYFIEAVGAGRVKIGVSSDVDGRLRSLCKQSPFPLRLLFAIDGDRKQERALHRRFDAFRVCGEWFRVAGELAEYLGSLCDRALESGALKYDVHGCEWRHGPHAECERCAEDGTWFARELRRFMPVSQ